MSPSFSTTKGVASTVLHVLVDRGLVDYDRCVADYWPEFAQAGKERITVRHILAHQSGLHHIRRIPPFGDMRILRIGGAVLRSASERRRVHIALQSPAVRPDPIASPAA